jgi:hypothetical protein
MNNTNILINIKYTNKSIINTHALQKRYIFRTGILSVFFYTLLSLTGKNVCNWAKRSVTSSSFLSLIKHRNLYVQKYKW